MSHRCLVNTGRLLCLAVQQSSLRDKVWAVMMLCPEYTAIIVCYFIVYQVGCTICQSVQLQRLPWYLSINQLLATIAHAMYVANFILPIWRVLYLIVNVLSAGLRLSCIYSSDIR